MNVVRTTSQHDLILKQSHPQSIDRLIDRNRDGTTCTSSNRTRTHRGTRGRQRWVAVVVRLIRVLLRAGRITPPVVATPMTLLVIMLIIHDQVDIVGHRWARNKTDSTVLHRRNLLLLCSLFDIVDYQNWSTILLIFQLCRLLFLSFSSASPFMIFKIFKKLGEFHKIQIVFDLLLTTSQL